MSGSLVLITGASGHLGFRVVVNALTAGHRVRAAVRSQARADDILASETIKSLKPGSALSFAIVPELLSPGVYDNAVKDVQYIIHTASPLAEPSDDMVKSMVEPAIKGTLNILEAAAKSPSVKRVVITSSVIAVIPWGDFIAEEVDRIFTANDVVPDSDAEGPFGHYFQGYAASKVKALNATKNFVSTKRPQFDVSNIMPGFFIGKSELVKESQQYIDGPGTNPTAFAQIMGRKSPSANPGTMVHVDDIAKVHVLALDPKVPGGQNFGMQTGGVDGRAWDDSLKVAKQHYAKEVEAGLFPVNGTQPSKRLRYDTSATEKTLGIKFRSYEEAVVSVIDAYLELRAKENSSSSAATHGH